MYLFGMVNLFKKQLNKPKNYKKMGNNHLRKLLYNNCKRYLIIHLLILMKPKIHIKIVLIKAKNHFNIDKEATQKYKKQNLRL
jgi:hypothetical protein